MRKDFRILGHSSISPVLTARCFFVLGQWAPISRAVDPMSAMPPLGDPNGRSLAATNCRELSREQARRAQVVALVLELWDAVRRDRLSEYLQPIP
jgi:hypothetical protein